MPPMQMDSNQFLAMVLNEFFKKFFNDLYLIILTKMYSKEELEVVMKEIFEKNVPIFEAVTKQVQMQDLGFYLEAKKALNESFDKMLKETLAIYDKPSSIITDKKE